MVYFKIREFNGGLIMPALEAKKNIYWVGVLDKELRILYYYAYRLRYYV